MTALVLLSTYPDTQIWIKRSDFREAMERTVRGTTATASSKREKETTAKYTGQQTCNTHCEGNHKNENTTY